MFLNLVILRNVHRDPGSQDPSFLRVSMEHYLPWLLTNHIPCSLQGKALPIPQTPGHFRYAPHQHQQNTCLGWGKFFKTFSDPSSR